jgi:hypothetical protein
MSALDVDAAARALASRALDQPFSPVEVDGLPEPVKRYLAASISPGTPIATAATMRAEDGDVAKSAAGRCGGEALWLPTALLPRFNVRWSAESSDHIVASFDLDATPLEIHLRIDERGLPTSVVLDRWGDPDRTGSFGWHRFGGTITDHQTFTDITVPSTGSWGWHYGTDRWSVGEFFRCRVTAHLPR